jgi:hypothetical protein
MQVWALDPLLISLRSSLNQLFEGFHFDAFGVAISTNPSDPGEVLPDPVEDPHESLLRNNKGIPIHEKDPVLPLHVLGSKQDVA